MPNVCLPFLGRSRNIMVAGQRAGGKLVEGVFADHPTEDSWVPRVAPGLGARTLPYAARFHHSLVGKVR